jgi:hypothetical protein
MFQHPAVPDHTDAEERTDMAADDSTREIRLAKRRALYAQNPEKHREWQRKNPARGAYASHKCGAKRRGIPFLLTFEKWWSIWQDSGKWEMRGIRRGCYVMARFGDVGPYAVGNVSIVPHEANSAAPNAAKNRTPKMRAVTAARNKARVWTPEARAKARAATAARFADPEARRRASEKQLAYLARRAPLV